MFIYGSRHVALWRLVSCTYKLPGNSKNSQSLPLRGVAWSYPLGEASLNFPPGQCWLAKNWMWRARVMVAYVICTDPGTYAHSYTKSFAKMINQVPAWC